MKIILLITIFTCCALNPALSAYTREKRLVRYPFPGPRADAGRDENAEAYGAAVAAPLSPRVKRKPQYEELVEDYSKETYSQPNGRSSVRSSASGAASAAQTYRPTVADPYGEQSYRSSQPSAYSSSGSPDSRYQSAGFASRSSGDSYESNNRKEAKAKEEAEEEKKPSRLELLLAQSKFTCNGKKDGYYADASVACQVFHYCVGGAKHSWQCPEGTVFHQVHLNCVPASQDICAQSEKFFVVNDYLHKPIDNGGPNNSVRYHQRYYPEEFLGDPLAAAFPAGVEGVQSYPAKPVAVGAGSGQSAPRSPQGYSDSYEHDYSGEDNRQSSPYRSQPVAAPRPVAPRTQPSYSPYSSKPKPLASGPPSQPSYTFSAKPYAGSGYASDASRSSYSNDETDERSSSPYRPTPSPYSGSTRPYSGYSGPSSSSSSSSPPYAPPTSSSSYSPYKPVTLSSPSPNYGYSRPSSSPVSSSGSAYNSKPSSVPYSSFPSYSPYSSSAYGSSAASERNVRPSSYAPRGYSGTSSKPYGYSGVTYEEDY
ncbi:uncharacterized protein LOC107371722 [Tetranychus urticae]|uniref:Chitin-binding type-2 domain-containing protein n=1 Tax=Tetranychus urticae TaxID=32264 RepID=T1JWD0_TETUR|nr:uncharacterized protein LOC107371722 [Tetranychus urticae]